MSINKTAIQWTDFTANPIRFRNHASNLFPVLPLTLVVRLLPRPQQIYMVWQDWPDISAIVRADELLVLRLSYFITHRLAVEGITAPSWLLPALPWEIAVRMQRDWRLWDDDQGGPPTMWSYFISEMLAQGKI